MSFIATLYVNPAQAIWPLDEVPRLTASALNPIPNHEAPGAFEWLRVEHIGGSEKYSALTTEDKKQVAKRCKALGLPSLLEFTSCEGIGPHLEVFNTAPSRPAWLLGYMPPSDPFHVQRVARVVDEKAHAKALEDAIRRGEIVQRLSNGTVLDGHIKIQGAVLARHDLEKFCASLLIDVQAKDTRPVFDIPVRPLDIPEALLSLPANTEVRHNDAPRAGWSGGGTGKASDLINAIREVIERQAAGRFTLREAAQIVADVHGVDAQWLLKRMTTAIDSPIPSERLKAYGADTRVARMPGEPSARVADYVKAPEFNAWLASVGDGLELPWRDSEHHSSEINVDTEGLNPHSLGAIAIEAAKLKAWSTKSQASERAKDICKASADVFLRECLSRLYALLEGGAITATNPVGGFLFLAGHDDPKSAEWLVTPEDKIKALTLLGVQPEAGQYQPGKEPAQPSAMQDNQCATDEAPNTGVQVGSTTWWSVASAYMVEKLKAGQHKTAKSLYHALEAEAGAETSPFAKGVGANRGSLFVKEISQTLSLKTVQNNWTKLKDAARSVC